MQATGEVGVIWAMSPCIVKVGTHAPTGDKFFIKSGFQPRPQSGIFSRIQFPSPILQKRKPLPLPQVNTKCIQNSITCF